MEILYYTKSFPRPEIHHTGIFNYFRYKELIKMGDHVSIIRPNHIRDREGKGFPNIRGDYNLRDITGDEQIIYSLNYLQIPKTQLYINLRDNLYKRIRQLSVQLVHVHFATFAYAAYLVKKKYNIPYVITCHGSDIHQKPFKDKTYKKNLIKSLNHADKVIFVSSFLHRIAKEIGYTKDNYCIIPNGIQSSIIDSSPSEERAKKTVGYIGSLNDVKRANLLPSIFQSIFENCKDVQFKVVGDGKYQQFIKDEMDKRQLSGSLEMLGALPHGQTMTHLKDFDLLVLPSKLEGFGNVILEANAKGVPVLASNNGGIPEALGKGGLLVNDGPDMIVDFGKKAREIFDNPIGYEDLQERVKSFTWDKTVRQERAVYSEILRNSNIE